MRAGPKKNGNSPLHCICCQRITCEAHRLSVRSITSEAKRRQVNEARSATREFNFHVLDAGSAANSTETTTNDRLAALHGQRLYSRVSATLRSIIDYGSYRASPVDLRHANLAVSMAFGSGRTRWGSAADYRSPNVIV